MSVWRLLAELDFMGGPGMDNRPDYTSGERHGKKWNFTPMQGAAMGGGPANATGDTGQQGVGRGGVGWGGRKDVSGGIRQPSAVYDKTWQTDEVHDAGQDEMERHGTPRNLWRDTPDGKEWTEMNNEAMGTPINFGMANKAGNMTGHTLPSSEREPAAKKNWIPEEEEMNLREFFDPSPIPVEEVDNPAQDHFKDGSDEDLETKIDKGFGTGMDDVPQADDDDEEMSIQAARMTIMPPAGPGGLLPPGGGAGGEVVDKASAWDVLQKVVDALGKNLNDGI